MASKHKQTEISNYNSITIESRKSREREEGEEKDLNARWRRRRRLRRRWPQRHMRLLLLLYLRVSRFCFAAAATTTTLAVTLLCMRAYMHMPYTKYVYLDYVCRANRFKRCNCCSFFVKICSCANSSEAIERTKRKTKTANRFYCCILVITMTNRLIQC